MLILSQTVSVFVKVSGYVELFVRDPFKRRIDILVAAVCFAYYSLFLAEHLSAALSSRTEIAILALRRDLFTEIFLLCHYLFLPSLNIPSGSRFI